MRTPEQIIGKDALMQLLFEGYAVVPATATLNALGAWYRRKYHSGSDYEAYRDLILVASGEKRAEDLWDDPAMSAEATKV